jgi:hypothetical protein
MPEQFQLLETMLEITPVHPLLWISFQVCRCLPDHAGIQPAGGGDPSGKRRHGGAAEIQGYIGNPHAETGMPEKLNAVFFTNFIENLSGGGRLKRRIGYEIVYVVIEQNGAVDLRFYIMIEYPGWR